MLLLCCWWRRGRIHLQFAFYLQSISATVTVYKYIEQRKVALIFLKYAGTARKTDFVYVCAKNWQSINCSIFRDHLSWFRFGQIDFSICFISKNFVTCIQLPTVLPRLHFWRFSISIWYTYQLFVELDLKTWDTFLGSVKAVRQWKLKVTTCSLTLL